LQGRPTNTKEELQKNTKLDFPTPFEPYLHSPLIVPHILHIVLASQVIMIAVLLANQRLLVFILRPITVSGRSPGQPTLPLSGRPVKIRKYVVTL